jgi:hypothetical protein
VYSKLLALVALALLTSVAKAQTPDETRCRSDASIYWAESTGRGTVTGLPTDVVMVFDGYGNLVFMQTVAWCINHPTNPFVYQTVAHSGGEISVRLNLYKFANVKGGIYGIARGGAPIDLDTIH